MILGLILALNCASNLVPFELGISEGFSLKNLFYLCLLYFGLLKRNNYDYVKYSYSIELLWLIFTIFTVISILFNINRFNLIPVEIIIKTIFEPLFVVAIIGYVKINNNDITSALDGIFYSISLMTLLSIIYYFFEIHVPATDISKNSFRMQGIFGDPNFTGAYLSSILPVGLLNYYNKSSKKYINLILVIILSVGIILTGSRGGIITLTLSWLFTSMIYLNYEKYNIKLIIITLLITLLITTVLYFSISENFYNKIIMRFTSHTNKIDDYTSGRLSTYILGIQSIKNDFFIGKGHLGFVGWHNKIHGYPMGIHNYFLDIFSNYGFIAFLSLLLVYIKSLIYGWKIKKYEPKIFLILISLFVVIQNLPYCNPIFFAVISVFSYQYYNGLQEENNSESIKK